mgnify:CR=1 FL=1
MMSKTTLPYEGNATAEEPLRKAGGIGPRDNYPNDPLKIDFINGQALQNLDKRQGKRGEPLSESSSNVQYGYLMWKLTYELSHESNHYSFTSRRALEISIERLKNWKLGQTEKKYLIQAKKHPLYAHA